MRCKTLAIPIRATDYSDSSQVVVLFSQKVGLLEGIAKGAYRPKSSFDGPFDLAVLYDVIYLQRRSANGVSPASGLAILAESTVLDGFRRLRSAWERHLAASHVLEFLRIVATHGEDAGELFPLVVDTFHELEIRSQKDLGAILLRFDLRALRILGLLPPVTACVSCGRVWPPSQSPVFFSSRAGGLVCRYCRRDEPRMRGVKLSGRAIRILQHLSQNEPLDFTGELRDDWENQRHLVTRTVRDLRNSLLERELNVLSDIGALTLS